MNITDETVKKWLQDQAAASGVKALILAVNTEWEDAPFHAKIKDNASYYGFGATAAKAIDQLKSQLPDARALAKKLRADAAKKIQEAEVLESITPAEVIADREGKAA